MTPLVRVAITSGVDVRRLGVNNEQSSEPNVDLSSDAVVMNACQDSDDVGCGVGGRRDH